LGAEGLARTLRLLIRQLETESHTRFLVELSDVKATPAMELLAYQVGREAIRNAIRHAGATVIRVHLGSEHETLRLVIEDDGRGFAQSLVDESSHFGLALMRERVDVAGGSVVIHSTEGRGTSVVVCLPRADPLCS
jgi:signal transduction histidine kinase